MEKSSQNREIFVRIQLKKLIKKDSKNLNIKKILLIIKKKTRKKDLDEDLGKRGEPFKSGSPIKDFF